MILAKNDKDNPDQVSFSTIERIERLILNCIGDRVKYLSILQQIYNEQEAEKLIDELMEIQQIPGFHCTPHTLNEMKQAIDYMVSKDDYYEERLQRKGKND